MAKLGGKAAKHQGEDPWNPWPSEASEVPRSGGRVGGPHDHGWNTSPDTLNLAELLPDGRLKISGTS